MNKLEKDKILREKLKTRKLQNQISKHVENENTVNLCREVSSFFNDKRYLGVKTLLETRLNLRNIERERLVNKCTTEFEYIKKTLVCDIEINLINDILCIPDNFAKTLKDLTEKEILNRKEIKT